LGKRKKLRTAFLRGVGIGLLNGRRLLYVVLIVYKIYSVFVPF
jgi:hypothetical protein